MISKKTVYIQKIIVFSFTGNGHRLALLISLNKLQLLVAIITLDYSVAFVGLWGQSFILSVINVHCSNLNMLGTILVRLCQGNNGFGEET